MKPETQPQTIHDPFVLVRLTEQGVAVNSNINAQGLPLAIFLLESAKYSLLMNQTSKDQPLIQSVDGGVVQSMLKRMHGS